jgi:cytochrome P450
VGGRESRSSAVQRTGHVRCEARDANHIAFAYGIHYRLGAPLARLEREIAFATLLARCDDIRLATPSDDVSYRITPNIRGVTGLPITFVAR